MPLALEKRLDSGLARHDAVDGEEARGIGEEVEALCGLRKRRRFDAPGVRDRVRRERRLDGVERGVGGRQRCDDDEVDVRELVEPSRRRRPAFEAGADGGHRQQVRDDRLDDGAAVVGGVHRAAEADEHDVVAAVDVVFANYYPFWEGQSVATSIAILHRQHVFNRGLSYCILDGADKGHQFHRLVIEGALGDRAVGQPDREMQTHTAAGLDLRGMDHVADILSLLRRLASTTSTAPSEMAASAMLKAGQCQPP